MRAGDAADEPEQRRERAQCAETDPETDLLERGTPWAATRACAGCGMRGECLEDALLHDDRFGVWGGRSAEHERRHHIS